MNEKQCCECRAGEHDNINQVAGLVVVKDPGTNHIVQRGYLCEDHLECRLYDGYNCYINGRLVETN